ncbi:MAG: TonB-dependent receptor [Thalassotalea sp.]
MKLNSRGCSFIVFFCLPAFAADKGKLEVIEVTAQKRIESVQEVPISLTAIQASDLDKFAISQAQDVASLVPNFNTARSISGVQNYFIRGVGLDDFNLSSVSAVGLYVDNIAIHNPMLSAFTLFDVARVEVLRGPQNTLYGKNTTGGAVKFITESPRVHQAKNGFAKVTLGSFNQQFFDLASNVQLGRDTAMRFSAYYHKADGQVTSQQVNNDTEYNNINQFGFRAKLAHKLTDNLKLAVSLYGGKQDQISAVKTIMVAQPDETIINLDDVDLSKNNSSLLNPRNDINAIGGFAKLTWQAEAFTFSSITSFESVESERLDDWGSQNIPSTLFMLNTYNSTDTQNYSQEFQLAASNLAHTWMLGFSINYDIGALAQAAYIDPVSQGRPDDAIDDAGGGPLFDRASLIDVDTLTYSLYGQYTKHLTQQLNLTAGYRLSQQKLSPNVHSAGMMMDSPDQPFPLGTFGWYSLGNPDFDVYRDYAGITELNNFVTENKGYAGTAEIDETFTQWGGKLGVDYQYNTDVLFYSSLSQGFKMGAVNSNPSSVTFYKLLDKVVKPETLTTLEAGWKSQFLSDKLKFNGAIFKNIWQDYQFFLVYNPGNPASLFASLVNLPEASSTGAELELDWLFTDNTRIKFGLGWLDTKVIDGQLDLSGIALSQQSDFQNQVVKGNKLTNAPEWVYNASVEKSVNFANSELDLMLQLVYTDEHIHVLAGENSEVWQENFSEKAVTVLNANASYFFGGDRQFQVSIWGKNLTDEQYCSERGAVTGTPTETVRLCAQGQPKMVGLTLNYLFD